MSFADLNNTIRSKTSQWVNLRFVGDYVSGKIVADPVVRDQSYKGTVITVTNKESANFGKPRQEWVFTLETDEGKTVKVGLKESAQSAIMAALNGRDIEMGGHIQLKVVAKEDGRMPEFKAVYSSPTKSFPMDTGSDVPDSDEPPF